jgi:hypothetical protein
MRLLSILTNVIVSASLLRYLHLASLHLGT